MSDGSHYLSENSAALRGERFPQRNTHSSTKAWCCGLPRCANGQTIRTIAREADVRQDRALPEWNRCNQRLTETRVSTLHITELVTFRGATLPEIPSSLLLTC